MADGLNVAQREAVQTLSGPLLVLAGAGTGKTRVITFRVANLIRHGVSADRILAVTFTNKAAQEMHQRIGAQLSGQRSAGRAQRKAPKPTIGTFHSLCVQILKRHANRLGYPENFTIYDRGDCEAVARGVLRELRVGDQQLRPGDLLGLISGWKSAAVRPAQASSLAISDRQHMAASAYRRYQQALRLAGAVDFDDLLLLTEQLFSEQPDVCGEEASRFDHVLVDEYQDTNGTQYRIVKALSLPHRNLCVVGDDDQSIYGWRGAEVRHILNFKKDWPDARVVRLEENYRSSGHILAWANRLIAFNDQRHEKVLRPSRGTGPPPRVLQFNTELEEAQGVADEIRRRLNQEPALRPRDFAILFRTNEQPRVFETELRKRDLPYILTGSQSFFDRKEVRDVLAYLRLLVSPGDEIALLRIINTPPRGLGSKSVELLLAESIARGGGVWQVWQQPEIANRLPPAARRGLGQLQSLLSGLRRDLDRVPLSEIAQRMLTELELDLEIRRQYDNPQEQEMRWASVQELVNALAEYQADEPEGSLGAFLSKIALAGREVGSGGERPEQKRDAISLMTYHSAKGLEFPIVYMIGMEEGLMPHRRSIDGEEDTVSEERRLCYVGITRAQDELTFSLALSRLKWGKPRPSFASRFLYEVTGQADNPNKLKAISAAAAQRRGGASASAVGGNKKNGGATPAGGGGGGGTTKSTKSTKRSPGRGGSTK
jgi:DNA helicase II / ATP-dependent DNA helicase PcrA